MATANASAASDGPGISVDLQQRSDHLLDLLLGASSVVRDSLLDLCWSITLHVQAVGGARHERDGLGLPDGYRGPDVFSNERLLYGRRARHQAGEEGLQLQTHGVQPGRERVRSPGLQHRYVHEIELGAVGVDYSNAHVVGARVNAQDAHWAS